MIKQLSHSILIVSLLFLCSPTLHAADLEKHAADQEQPKVTYSELDNYDLFKTVQNIREAVDRAIADTCNGTQFNIENGRKWPINPHFQRTKGGIQVVMGSTLPYCICTPWGEVKLTGSSYLNDRIEKRFLRIFWENCTHHKVGDPVLYDSMLSQDECRKIENAWDRLQKQYDLDQKK